MPIYALIPGLPLLAFLLLALGGRRGETSHRLGTPAVAASFGLSLAALVEVIRTGPFPIHLYRLLDVGELAVDVSLYVDQLTVVLLALVTGVSFIVHVYSSRYMTGDPRHRRFFAVMALFTGAMALLVMSNNLLLTYMCWELMGICSYLLISHWAERPSAGRAATKAFLVNAVADVGLGFGIVLTFATYGTLDIQEIAARAASMDGETVSVFGAQVGVNSLIALGLLSGALGKSAQLPLHTWLPYAMEAPTPVSALIHAATMVNAGPFLLVRLSPLVLLAPAVMAAIAVVGAATALYGLLVSLTQADIKKALAYSTISQIGFMIFACGVGAFSAAVFHLLAHGFFKGFLFLSTGSVLDSVSAHAPSEGRLAAKQVRPLALGALVLACVPACVLFAGPYEAIWTAQQAPSAQAAFWVVGLGTVFVTAVYAFRGVVTLFGAPVGRSRAAWPQLLSPAHAPGLAAVVVAAAGLLLGLWAWFGPFLAPAVGGLEGEPGLFRLSPALLAALAAAAVGWGWAWHRYVRPKDLPLARRNWAQTAYVLFWNGLYIDELHQALAVEPTVRLSRWLLRRVDLGLVDRASMGAAHCTRLFADSLRGADRFARRIGRLGENAGAALQRIEPRTLQQHLVIVTCWLVVAVGLLYWLAL